MAHEVTISVSEDYTVIAGGYTGMRPVGRRRDYRANVLGRDIHKTNKAEIQSRIRQLIYQEEERCGFVHAPVKFTFVRED